MKMYEELAEWWPLLSSPADYADEAAAFLPMLSPVHPGRRSLLELGSGGGNLASHLKAHFDVTLSDRAPRMVDVSRRLNPELEHIVGDMRTLRLGRTFDVVLIHDAITYCTTLGDVRDVLDTAALHCHPGGTVMVVPDDVRETYQPGTETGGEDGEDGRSLRYLEWSGRPQGDGSLVEVLYVIVLREADGGVRVELDRHLEGLFSEREWLDTFNAAGLPARVLLDRWGRHVFLGTRTPRPGERRIAAPAFGAP